MPVIATLAALALAAAPGDAATSHAPAPDEAPPSIELAGLGALILAADPEGDGPEPRPGFGLRAAYELPALARPWFLRAEAAWLHVAWDDGTRAVNVLSTVDTLGLPLAAGHEWSFGSWWLSPYLLAGPSLVRTVVRYHVEDPLAGEARDEDVGAFDLGAIYGGGARLALAAGSDLALALRVEALGLRRGVADDLALAGTLGLLF